MNPEATWKSFSSSSCLMVCSYILFLPLPVQSAGDYTVAKILICKWTFDVLWQLPLPFFSSQYTYLCGNRGGNTRSMLMEIVVCQLWIFISINLCVDSEMMQLMHSPLHNLLLPWHASFSIILITKSAPAIHVESSAHSLEPAPTAATSASRARLPTDRLPCLRVILFFPTSARHAERGNACTAITEEDVKAKSVSFACQGGVGTGDLV